MIKSRYMSHHFQKEPIARKINLYSPWNIVSILGTHVVDLSLAKTKQHHARRLFRNKHKVINKLLDTQAEH